MKFLITGGAGFIGGNYCRFITKKYPKDIFVCLDALTYAGNMESIRDIVENQKNFIFVKGNICDRDFVFSLFDKEHFDYVINFAAETHVDRSIKDPGIFIKSNIIGVQTLMDACRQFGIKRFHQVSTDEVYGDLPLDEPKMLFTENLPLKASSPYSASKASADLFVLAFHRTYGLPVTISRCSNNYGPYQFPEKLIPLMIEKALNNEKLPIYGNGQNVRDWLYVTDHCNAIDLIIRYGHDGEIYNIGGHNEKSNIEIVKTILKYMNKSFDLIEFVKDRPGHDLRYAMDPTKIESELGWKPNFNFESGIIETIKWNIDNNKWLNDIKDGTYQKNNEKY